MKTFNSNANSGFMLVQTVIFAALAVLIIGGLSSWSGANIKLAKRSILREKSIQIAEAGVDYYRWHLAHDPQDFTDGTGNPGPYIHDFNDKNGVKIGTFSLSITPPLSGSTIVTIESTGTVVEDLSIQRTIRTRLAIPSLAKYAFVSNSDMRFGAGTEIFGQIHSNGGIRFDGLSHNIISSARSDYDDPDHAGGNEFGVHTHVNAPPGTGINDTFRPNEAPPTTPVPYRPDVFEAGRQFPVPAVDFVGLTTDLAQIKASAQSSGRYFAASGGLGYRIVFNPVSNGTDTFSIYRINTLRNPPGGCTKPAAPAPPATDTQIGWGTWSIGTTGGSTTLIGTYQIPSNGLIFVEDHAWVSGTINGDRVTVASGRFPDVAATRTSITMTDSLNYTNTNGTDVIALIAQNNINIGLYSADSLDIDAALIAQSGRVGRYYYNTSCSSSYHRQQINLYGMIATSQRYGFTYTGSNWNCGGTIGNIGSGYCTRNIVYDANLLFGPPPSFPLTSDQYSTISWEEL
ncbi:MAG: hypothetical protein AAB534_03115 [Patescibacteria group bacterium]